MQEIKRGIYIFLFTVLGIEVGFLLHGFIEMIFLSFYVENLGGGRVSFSTLRAFHAVFLGFLLWGGALFGFWQGKFWWRIVYERGMWGRFSRRIKRLLGL